MATIAWIGLGHMGIRMSKNMLKAGYVVRGVDIDPKQAKAAHEAGVQIFDTPAQACAGVDAVFTMVPAGPDVEKIMTGPDGVFANLPKGAIAIDTSTIGIAYAKKIHAAARNANVAFVEAPVSGGVEGAADASLTFMIGGADKYVERVKTLLKPMGHFMSHVGGAGAGQAAKVANNLIMGVCVTVNAEASLMALRLEDLEEPIIAESLIDK
jgi:3-hydroxyisobutyrate dehydrogenase